MTNEELKALAEKVIAEKAVRFGNAALAEFAAAATPDMVLGLIAELEKFDDGMRALACNLGAGGYNAVTLTADQLVGKVSAGLEMFTTSTGGLLDKVTAERDALKAECEGLRKDAGRWRAFVSCARIKFFGWAGYAEKDPYGNSPGNYRHFGGEFWTIHDAPTADKEKAIEILNGFADAAVSAMGQGESS